MLGVLRQNNLVYIPIQKNASTTFRQAFTKIGWKHEHIETVNWDTDTVFAHIQNPVVRYQKGIVQFIDQYKLSSYLDDQRINFMFCGCALDEHSLPMTFSIGEHNLYKIDWIPMDHPDRSLNDLTNLFFEQHNIPLDCTQLRKENPSSLNKKEIERKLSLLCFSQTKTFSNFVLERDIMLYNRVTKSCNLAGQSWDKISWINNRNISQWTDLHGIC